MTLALCESNESLMLIRFSVLTPKHPTHSVCLMLIFSLHFQTNPFWLWTSWHCACPWVLKSKADCSFLITWFGLSAQQRFGFQVWLHARCNTRHSHSTKAGSRAHRFTDLLQAPENHAPTCWSPQTNKQLLNPEDGSGGIKLYLTSWSRDVLRFAHLG